MNYGVQFFVIGNYCLYYFLLGGATKKVPHPAGMQYLCLVSLSSCYLRIILRQFW